jgi:hypothetical protein
MSRAGSAVTTDGSKVDRMLFTGSCNVADLYDKLARNMPAGVVIAAVVI